jgi:predicted O-methyltransferase YrrM
MTQDILKNYLKKLKASGIERKIPNITEENAEFIKDLIRDRKSKYILEIWTANGYSTLQFASVFSDSQDSNTPTLQHSITTIEYAYNAHIEAVEHFSNCKMKNIHAMWWDAKAVIPTLRDGYFDLVYIDAMKREYLDYLLLSLSKMTPDALVIIDDVEKFRDKMENLYDWLAKNKIPYTLEKTDVDDSIMLIEYRDIQKHIS